MILNKLDNVIVKISNDYFIYSSTNKEYYKVLFFGNNYKLYKKVYKTYYNAKRAETSFHKSTLASFEDRIIYYLVSKEDEFKEIPSSKNQRFKFFGNKKEEIKTYVTKYNLDITDEKIFIKIVRYFDSMKDVKW